ncbi:hypothetical protein KC344_g121 [Hortaea werneckii]|nr:hypothetical protein KC344_g121 [Hortaea werneckii]
MHVTERHDLAGNHSCHAFLPVAPPEQVRYSGPPSGILASAGGARLDRHHETKTPALRGLAFLGIQFWRWVRLLRFGGRILLLDDSTYTGNLIRKHFVYCMLLEDLCTRVRACAIVEQGCQHLDIFLAINVT